MYERDGIPATCAATTQELEIRRPNVAVTLGAVEAVRKPPYPNGGAGCERAVHPLCATPTA